MLAKFWESTGEGLSEQWFLLIFGPGFLFWGSGILIVVGRIGLIATWNWILSLALPAQSALLIIAILILAGSSTLMEYVRFGFLRFLEGYWFWPLGYLGILGEKIQRWNIQNERRQWNILMDKAETGILSSVEKRKLSQLEVRGHYVPANLDDCMPTKLGNILRGAETVPLYRYGLDPVICWSHLWLLLPADARDDLNKSRQHLDRMVELWGWGALFLVWTMWWGWAALIGFTWMILGYTLVIQAATTYSDLVTSAFDLYRWNLYSAVHWALPKCSGDGEVKLGKQLTEFLWRGTSDTPVNYKHPQNNPD